LARWKFSLRCEPKMFPNFIIISVNRGYVCVCVCVCEREREREREGGSGEGEREKREEKSSHYGHTGYDITSAIRIRSTPNKSQAPYAYTNNRSLFGCN